MVTEMTQLEKQRRREKGFDSPTLASENKPLPLDMIAIWSVIVGIPALVVFALYYGIISV
jgi:hypothetical protein